MRFYTQNVQKLLAAGASLQTPLGSLQLLRSPNWIQRGERRGKGRGRKLEKEREGMEEKKEERERGEIILSLGAM